MLLFGGCASGFGPCPLGDLWSFDLTTNRWTEKTSQPSPFPRSHYGTAFDATRRRMIVFGGTGSGSLNDTWEYDPRSDSWRKLTIPNPPSARSRVQGTFAADLGAVYFFGGTTSSGNTNELWALNSGVFPETPEPVIGNNAIINVFSGATSPVAPGEIVSLFGENLGPSNGIATAFDAQTNRLPKSSANVSVTWNGIPAPLFFVRQDQVNVQVPYELSGLSEAQIVIQHNGRASSAQTIAIAHTHPGLYPAVWNQDGSVNAANNPAALGSVVILYATGQGVTEPPSITGTAALGPYPEPVAPTQLEIGGVPAEILFRGQAPGTAGVMQINARVPNITAGTHAVKVTIGGDVSQEIALVVR
jgi:uncharacterized protein (TIGR03437 family)